MRAELEIAVKKKHEWGTIELMRRDMARDLLHDGELDYAYQIITGRDDERVLEHMTRSVLDEEDE